MFKFSKEKYCAKPIDTITNFMGQPETRYCVKEPGHSGRCSFKPRLSVEAANKLSNETLLHRLVDKIDNATYSTAGETASNSPIKNRGNRYADTPISKKEQYTLKKQGKYRFGIRKDEASTFENCQNVAIELSESIEDIILEKNTERTKCPICLEYITLEELNYDRHNHKSIQSCHLEPLSEDVMMHKAGNVSWGHRICNIMQNDSSITETVERLKKIVSNHNHKKVGGSNCELL